MDSLMLEKQFRIRGTPYAALIGAVVADQLGRDDFLCMPASEQAYGLAVLAAAGGDSAMAERLTAEYMSLRQPQFIAVEHVKVALGAAARLQRNPWIPAALSDPRPHVYGGPVGKWIR